MNVKTPAIIAAAAALALSACGSDDSAGGMSITDSWARTSAAGQTTGAVYFQIESADDDELLAASVPASVAAEAQIHEVVMADMTDDTMTDDTADGEMTDDTADGEMTDDTMADDMAGDDTADSMGAMTMQEIAALALPAGETVSLEPGGYHIMLLTLPNPSRSATRSTSRSTSHRPTTRSSRSR